MLRRHSQCRRHGATLVEAAIVYPVLCLLLLCGLLLWQRVTLYQQLAMLAREGARYASVRGYAYSVDTGSTAATSTSVQTYVRGKAPSGFTTSSLTVTTTWNTDNHITHTSGSSTIKNTVSVTVSYP